MTAETSFEQTVLALSPVWAKGEDGEKLQRTQGRAIGQLVTWAENATRATMPGVGTNTALGYSANDMQLERGRIETDDHFAVRLQGAVDSHRKRGTPNELLRQLAAWFHPDTDNPIRLVSNSAVWHEYDYGTGEITKTIVGDNWNWDDNTTKWFRGWVIIDVSGSGLWEPWEFDDGPDFGDDIVFGGTMTENEVKSLRRLVTKWKPGNVNATIIISFDGGLFQRTNDPGVDNPDGEYGVAADRSEDACYIERVL